MEIRQLRRGVADGRVHFVPFELVKEEGEVSNTEKLNRGYESTPWASENHSYTLLQLPSKSDNRVGLRVAVKGDTRTRLRTENAEALSCIGRLSRAVFLTLDRLFWDIYSSLVLRPGQSWYCQWLLRTCFI
jgi:hypothetical protein